MLQEIAHQHTTDTLYAPWSEQAIEEAISTLKAKESVEALQQFLEDRILELTEKDGASTLLARLHNELGLTLLYGEEMENAQAHLDKAMALNPDNINAAYNRGNISFYLKEFEKALEIYALVLKKAPDHTGATYNAALCHALTGQVTEALPLFQKVVVLSPDYTGAHFWAGECLLHQGAPETALPFFRRASELNPDHSDSCRGLAICLFHAGQHEEAIALCETMLKTFGPELTALRIKGDALLAINKPTEAAQSHVDMALIDFDAQEFLLNRSTYLLKKDPEMAQPYIQCVLHHFPDFKRTLDPDDAFNSNNPTTD